LDATALPDVVALLFNSSFFFLSLFSFIPLFFAFVAAHKQN
jgi:hypothetical protein